MYEDLKAVATLKLTSASEGIARDYQKQLSQKSADLAGRGLADSGMMQQARIDAVVAAAEKRCRAESDIWTDLIARKDGRLTREGINFVKEQVRAAGEASKNNASGVLQGVAVAMSTGSIDAVVRDIERELEVRFRESELFGSSSAVKTVSIPDAGPEITNKSRRVWVVHGRDERLRQGVFDFLRSIKLEPIEFSEARKLTGKPMPYVGEILEAAFQHAQAVVVLLTPDDEARLRPELQKYSDPAHEKILTGQARPNVLFEAGMALVSHPDQTILVQFGNVRPFSDVAGKHIVHMDSSTQKRQELASRLQDAGCPVNMNGTDWHTSGDLQPVAIADPAASQPDKKPAKEIVDKWVNAGYENQAGIAKELRDQGYELAWVSAKNEAQKVDIEGWERVIVDQPDGNRAVLKIHDAPIIGGHLILLKKHRGPFDSQTGIQDAPVLAGPATAAKDVNAQQGKRFLPVTQQALTVRLDSGHDQGFLILVESQADQEFTILGVAAECNDSPLGRINRPPDGETWVVPARGRLTIRWANDIYPVRALLDVKGQYQGSFREFVVFVFDCSVDGKHKAFRKKITVQVDALNRNMTQWA